MADCVIFTETNKEESLLYKKLLSINTDEHNSWQDYLETKSNHFKNLFGDFEGDPDSVIGRVDENGEPLIHYNKKINKFYVLDKYNEQLFFPYRQLGIKKYLTSSEISDFTKAMAFDFYQRNINFDTIDAVLTASSEENIYDSIKSYIHTKAAILRLSSEFSDKALANSLDASLENIDEWVDEVKAYFKAIKINVISEDDILNEEQSTAGSTDIIRTDSFLRSAKDSASNNVKLYLSLIPDNKENSFGDIEFVSFDEVYTVLNNALRDIETEDDGVDEFQLYLDEIEKMIPYKPYLKKIYEDLSDKNLSSNIKTQFTQAFRLVKNNFLGSELIVNVDKKTKTISYSVKNLSEVSARKNNIIEQWRFNTSVMKINKKTIARRKMNFESLFNSIAKKGSSITEAEFNRGVTEFKSLLSKIGVILTDEGLKKYLNEGVYEGVDLATRADNLMSSIEKVMYEIDNALTKEDFEKEFLSNQTLFKELAAEEAFFIGEGSDATIYSIGKSKWIYSKASYLSRKINKWKKNPARLIKYYESTIHTSSSLYMDYLTASEIKDYDKRIIESKKRLSKVELNIFNSVQAKGDATNAVDNKSITYTDALNDHLHKLLGSRYKNGKTYHKTGLASDKATEYQLFLGNDPGFFSLSSGVTVQEDGSFRVSNRIISIFYNYFKAEYARMNYERKFAAIPANKDKLRTTYHLGAQNAFKSQLFPSMSIEIDKKTGDVALPDLDFDLYDEQGVPLYDEIPKNIESKIKEKIVEALSDRIENTYNLFFENKLIKFDANNNLVNQAIDSELFDILKGEGSAERASVVLAADSVINGMVSQIEYSKMFSGDPAYFQDLDTYYKRVPGTYTDGQYVMAEKGKETFNISVIAPVVISPVDFENMKLYLPESVWSNYENKVNSTDGQAWITPERWRDIMKGIGKDEKTVDSIYKKMYSEKPIYSDKETKYLSTVLKGVHWEIDEEGAPIFLKYSQSVIIPSAFKGTGLSRLLDKMQDKEMGIDELVTLDGIKVGSILPTIVHDPITGEVLDNFELNKMTLQSSEWKLQQDLPVKGIKDTDVGTQLIKNIFLGLAFDNEYEKFYLNDGTEMSGGRLGEYIDEIVGAMTSKGVSNVTNELGIDENFKLDDDKMFDMLIEQMESRQNVPENFIKALKAGVSPYGIIGAKVMIQNMFGAYITDSIVKIKTKGAGFIQVSDFGLTYNEVEKSDSKIRLTPWFSDNKLSPPKVIGINSKTGKEIIEPAGIFISDSIISKYLPNWESFTNEELFGVLNKDTGRYEGGVIDENILRNIIGYRIPNQALASSDALQIMGIIPGASSDTVIPYVGITTKTGSDFDIDKMYLMIPSFKTSWDTNFEEVYDFIKKNIHESTVGESINSINNLLKELEVDDDKLKEADFSANNYFDEEGNKKDQASIAISKNDSALVSALLNEANRNHPLVIKLFKDVKIDLIKLEYIDPVNNVVDIAGMKELPLDVLRNKLIDAFKSILTSKNVIEDVMKPIDSSFLNKDMSNLNDKQKLKDLEGFDSIQLIETKHNYMQAKAGLGQSVNSFGESIKGSKGNLYLIKKYLGKGNFNEDLETKFDEEYTEELTDKDIEEYVLSYNSKERNPSNHISFDDVKKYAKMKIADVGTARTNGFVDAGKDNSIVEANWNTQTSGVGLMLDRAGVHPLFTDALLKQPAITSYVKFIANMRSNVIDNNNKVLQEFKLKMIYDSIDKSEEYNITNFEEEDFKISKKELFRRLVVIDNVKYFDTPGSLNYTATKDKFTDTILPLKILKALDIEATVSRKNVKKDDKNKGKSKIYTKDEFDQAKKIAADLIREFERVFEPKIELELKNLSLNDLRNELNNPSAEFQTSILMIFKGLQDYAKEITKSIEATKFDVEGPGKDISSLFIFQNLYDDLMNNKEEGTLGGFETKFEYNGSKKLLHYMKRDGLDFTYEIMKNNPKFFLSADDSAFTNFNIISNLIYGNTLQSEKLGFKLEKFHYSYFMSKFPPLVMNKKEKKNLLINIPSETSAMARKYPNNELLKRLYEKRSEGANLADNVEETKSAKSYANYFLAFPSLKTSSSVKNKYVEGWRQLLEEEPKFANKLIKYSFLISGFNQTMSSFHETIPYEWSNKNGFNSYLKSLRNKMADKDHAFIDQFFRNHSSDYTITRSVFITNSNFIEGIHSKVAFKSDNNLGYFVSNTSKDGDKVSENFYRLLGSKKTNEGLEYIYVISSPLGFKDSKGNKFIEIEADKKDLQSIVFNNRPSKRFMSNYNAVIKNEEYDHEQDNELKSLKKLNKLLDYDPTAVKNNEEEDKAVKEILNIVSSNNKKVLKDEVVVASLTDLLFFAKVRPSSFGGNLIINGVDYKAQESSDRNSIIKNKDGSESLIIYTAEDIKKKFPIIAAIKQKGEKEFKLATGKKEEKVVEKEVESKKSDNVLKKNIKGLQDSFDNNKKFFKKEGINSEEDLKDLSSKEINELIKKLCK